MLQKSMFPKSGVRGEYMFLDLANEYFIQLSVACMRLHGESPFISPQSANGSVLSAQEN